MKTTTTKRKPGRPKKVKVPQGVVYQTVTIPELKGNRGRPVKSVKVPVVKEARGRPAKATMFSERMRLMKLGLVTCLSDIKTIQKNIKDGIKMSILIQPKIGPTTKSERNATMIIPNKALNLT